MTSRRLDDVGTADVGVYIDPFSRGFERDGLFAPSGGSRLDDNPLGPFMYLKEWLGARGVELHTADMMPAPGDGPATKLYFSFGLRERYQLLESRPDVVLSGMFAFECPIVDPELYKELAPASRLFRRVFSFSTLEALSPFLTGDVTLLPFRLPQFFEDVHVAVWQRRHRKFLVLINSNKLPRLELNELYSERLRALEFFDRHEGIDLYGVGWDGPALRVGRHTRLPGRLAWGVYRARRAVHRRVPPRDRLGRAIRRRYCGVAPSKAETLGQYTFAVCFENSRLKGWVTEKLFDCFFAGTVPVYWGAPDIEDWVPAGCFIDMRRFDSYGELRSYLLSLTSSDVERYRLAAREFLRSEQYRPFTKQTFAERIGSIVEVDSGVVLQERSAVA